MGIIRILAGSLFLVLLASFLPNSEQAPPEIFGIVEANLHEEVSVETELVCVNCSSPDGLDVEVSDTGVSPFTKFFDVYKLTPTSDYCIYYLPSEGSPDYSRIKAYYITLTCSDGTESSTATAEIQILPNEPPVIDSPTLETCTIDAQNTAADAVIYSNLLATDPDNDLLYYSLTTVPASAVDNYNIGQNDGIITAKNDLKAECNSDVLFYINVTDNKNTAVGPVIINCNVINEYTAPTISNANTEIFVAENTTVGTNLITFDTSPKTPSVSYTIVTDPTIAGSLFEMNTGSKRHEMDLAGLLNYEDPDLQNINISITVDNGYCTPETSYLYLRVTDANDVPELGPKNQSVTEYEGPITFNPNFFVIDEDYVDKHTYSIIGGTNENYFTIDPDTGVISSIDTYDVDLNAMPDSATLLVQVIDSKGAAVDNATVNINILDANDNPPKFPDTAVTYSVEECDSLGTVLGNIGIPYDNIDSNFQNNDLVSIEADSNSYISVTAGGDVIHRGTMPAGTVQTLNIYAKDHGTYPRNLQSIQPMAVTVVSTPCTTTVASSNSNSGSNSGSGTNVATTAAATTAKTTTTTAATSTCTGIFCDPGMIALAVLGGLLTLGLLGLLGGLIYRYCCNRPIETRRSWTPPKKVRPITPPTPPPRTPATPRQVEPEIRYVPVPFRPPPPPLVRVKRQVPVTVQPQLVKVKQMVQVPENVKVRQLVPVPNGNAPALPAPTPPASGSAQ